MWCDSGCFFVVGGAKLAKKGHCSGKVFYRLLHELKSPLVEKLPSVNRGLGGKAVMAVKQEAKSVPNFTLPSDLSGKVW